MSVSLDMLRERLSKSLIEEIEDDFYEVPFFALGSECELYFSAVTFEVAQAFVARAFEWLAQFEARHSRFLPDSEISRINANAGVEWTDIHPETDVLLDLCGHSNFVSEGAFDATSLPLSRLWDWKRKHDSLPTEDEIAAAKSLVGWKSIERSPGRIFLPQKGMMLDFGGVGKEFAVDCLKQLAVACGIQHVMVDLGGDIAVQGEPPEGGGWYVGLEDPSNTDNSHCGIRLKDRAAVATSGDYRRCFQHNGRTYGHILDCRTGWPVANGTRSVTVIASRCTEAGLLATSAMIIGGADAVTMLERTPGVQGCVWSNGRLFETRGFRRSVLPKGWDDDANE